MTTNLTTADRSADAKTALLDALKRAHAVETYCNGNVSIDGEILDKGPFEATAMSWDGTADGLEDLGWERAADAMRDDEEEAQIERAAAWEDAAAEAGDPATMLIAGIARGAPSASILGRTPEEIEAEWPLLRAYGSSGAELAKLLKHPRLAMELVDSWGDPHDDDE